jgi:hypothetical protein
MDAETRNKIIDIEENIRIFPIIKVNITGIEVVMKSTKYSKEITEKI